MDALIASRLQFAFTIMYHYLFPQLTMGLTFLIVVLKIVAWHTKKDVYTRVARFFIKILAITFVFGVVTGIPMEFQFGTNWSKFSEVTGAIIGQTLAMEGLLAFALESSCIYLLLYQEKRLGPKWHFVAAVFCWIGTWASAFFILATNSWMQHPVGYSQGADGNLKLESLTEIFMNPWFLAQYPHNQNGAVITGSFTMVAISAFFLLRRTHVPEARAGMRVGVIVGFIASLNAMYPTGDAQAKNVHKYQPVTFSAMEGVYQTAKGGAGIALFGQPNIPEMKLDNPIVIPEVLSILTFHRWGKNVPGLVTYPKEDWPDNPQLLYYAYHVMAGLGSMFFGLMSLSLFLMWRKRLYHNRWILWPLMLLLPFPFICNEAGWLTAELGRQPWLVHGVFRTADGVSPHVPTGNVIFTLVGFAGSYLLLSVLALVMFGRAILKGPDAAPDDEASSGDPPPPTAVPATTGGA